MSPRAGGAEQGVGHGVQHDVGVGVADQPARVLDPDAAQDQGPALDQPVRVVTDPHPHAATSDHPPNAPRPGLRHGPTRANPSVSAGALTIPPAERPIALRSHFSRSGLVFLGRERALTGQNVRAPAARPLRLEKIFSSQSTWTCDQTSDVPTVVSARSRAFLESRSRHERNPDAPATRVATESPERQIERSRRLPCWS